MNAPLDRIKAQQLATPRRFAPLRMRLALAFAAAVAAALIIFGAVVTVVVWRAEVRESQEKAETRRKLLDHEATELARRHAAGGKAATDRDADAQADADDKAAVMTLEEFGDDQDVSRVVSAMLFSAPLVVLAAAAFGLWLARRALKPLREASAQVQAARASVLSVTLPVRGAGDEWDELATTLNQLLAEARGSMVRIQRFTADAAHELRTPLTTLIGEAELALRRERPALELRAALEVVRDESQRMAQLVEALLALSRADAGTLLSQSNPSRVDLGPLLRDAAARAHARAERAAKPFDIALTLEQEGPMLARGEPVLLARAVGNLLDNAVDHGGRKVSIDVRAAGTMLVVQIEDDGPGIAPALRTRLFERFARADVSRTSDGFGLGLALARAIVQAHGGALELGREGAGALFEIRLPRG